MAAIEPFPRLRLHEGEQYLSRSAGVGRGGKSREYRASFLLLSGAGEKEHGPADQDCKNAVPTRCQLGRPVDDRLRVFDQAGVGDARHSGTQEAVPEAITSSGRVFLDPAWRLKRIEKAVDRRLGQR